MDHLEEVFDKYSEEGQCDYCGKSTKVKDEPFGQRPACKECYFQIIDGDEN